MQKYFRSICCAGMLLFLLIWMSGCRRSPGVRIEEFETETNMQNVQYTEAVQAVTEAPAVYVYVCGAVRIPGVYQMKQGMRVFEAVSLAGGFTGEADQEWLNQAEAVEDGQKITVYTKQETAQMSEAEVQEKAQESNTDDRVNLNTASREELMTLPGIGEAKAEAVLQYRETNGAFQTIEEIQNIPGIKSAVFSKIKDRIKVQ